MASRAGRRPTPHSGWPALSPMGHVSRSICELRCATPHSCKSKAAAHVRKHQPQKEASTRILPTLQGRLYDLEKACWDHGAPTVILFEGWDASGKGTTISALTQRLDPRGFKLYPITAPRTYELQRPWLWRFWLKVPNRGEMVIYDHSWYGRVLEERVERTVPEKVWRQAYRDIVDFERMLADDGATILKFFFHIGKKEQKERFETIEKDPLEAWRVT